MPKSPQGQKRPADVISNAVLVMKSPTGDVRRLASSKRPGGIKGGPTRARALSDSQLSDIARVAAEARWKTRR